MNVAIGLEATTTGKQPGTTIGVSLCALNLLVGAFLGSYLGGVESSSLGGESVDMTTVVVGGGSFNWLLFAIFAAAAAVCLAVGVAAGSVSAAIHNATVIQQRR